MLRLPTLKGAVPYRSRPCFLSASNSVPSVACTWQSAEGPTLEEEFICVSPEAPCTRGSPPTPAVHPWIVQQTTTEHLRAVYPTRLMRVYETTIISWRPHGETIVVTNSFTTLEKKSTTKDYISVCSRWVAGKTYCSHISSYI